MPLACLLLGLDAAALFAQSCSSCEMQPKENSWTRRQSALVHYNSDTQPRRSQHVPVLGVMSKTRNAEQSDSRLIATHQVVTPAKNTAKIGQDESVIWLWKELAGPS